MVADPQDGERVTRTFRLKYSGEDVDGKWKEMAAKLVFECDAPKKRRHSVTETNRKERQELEAMREELKLRESALHQDLRRVGGLRTCMQCQQKDEEAKEVGKKRVSERKLRTEAESSLVEVAAQLGEQEKRVQELTKEIDLLEKEVRRSSDRASQAAGAVKRQMAKALEARERVKELRANTVSLETCDGVAKQLAEQRELAEQLGWEKEDLEEKLEEKKAELARATDTRPGRGRHAETEAAVKFRQLRADIGLKGKYTSVPPRVAEMCTSDAGKLSVRHMAAVLGGRGEGDNINLVADALHRAGYLEKLFDADRVLPLLKGVVKDAVHKTQAHWTARHAVHVWDRLELSRSQMDTLRHLLSHVYDAATDSYLPIKSWVRSNPYPYP